VAVAATLLAALPFHAWAQQEPTPTTPAAEAAPARADLTAARELVKAGKYDEANATLSETQASFPDDPSLLLLRGEVLIALKQPDQAVPLLRHAAEVAPNKKRVHFQLGTALSATGDSAGAVEAFAKEIEINPDPKVVSMARLNRKILFENDKKFGEAAAELEQAIQADPEPREAYGELAELYLDAGKPDDAQRAIERAEAVGFQSSRLHFRMGVAYYNQKVFDKAAASFSRAVEIQPDLAQAEMALARSLDKQGLAQEANAHYQRYLELDPKAPEAAELKKRLQASAKPKGGKSK
jgi:superkiller protein 3